MTVGGTDPSGRRRLKVIVKGDFDARPIPLEEHNNQRVLLPIVALNPRMLWMISNYHWQTTVSAWMLWFTMNGREKCKSITNAYLSVQEIRKVERLWWQIAQRSAFQEEIKDLKNGKEISHNSKIVTYRPFVDDQDLLGLAVEFRKQNWLSNPCKKFCTVLHISCKMCKFLALPVLQAKNRACFLYQLRARSKSCTFVALVIFENKILQDSCTR